MTSTIVTRGTTGGVSLQVLTKSIDAITLGEWYQSLANVWVPNVFNETDYRQAMRALAEELEGEGSSSKDDVGSSSSDKEALVDALLDHNDDVDEILLGGSSMNGVSTTTEPTRDTSSKGKTTTNVPSSGKGKRGSSSSPVNTDDPFVHFRGKWNDLPDGVERDDRPAECPGYGCYTSTLPACVVECTEAVSCLAYRTESALVG